MRTLPILIAVLAVASAGCASPDGRALPTCDGKHLRSANPHGSMLDATAPASSATSATAPAGAHASCGR